MKLLLNVLVFGLFASSAKVQKFTVSVKPEYRNVDAIMGCSLKLPSAINKLAVIEEKNNQLWNFVHDIRCEISNVQEQIKIEKNKLADVKRYYGLLKQKKVCQQLPSFKGTRHYALCASNASIKRNVSGAVCEYQLKRINYVIAKKEKENKDLQSEYNSLHENYKKLDSDLKAIVDDLERWISQYQNSPVCSS